jgi:hypothetical protein
LSNAWVITKWKRLSARLAWLDVVRAQRWESIIPTIFGVGDHLSAAPACALSLSLQRPATRSCIPMAASLRRPRSLDVLLKQIEAALHPILKGDR